MYSEKLKAFERTLQVLDRLRVECPWDRKQTNESLRSYTIEEVFELSDALLKNDVQNIKIELGDVLLHLVFYAKIAEEKGQFTMADVCNSLCEKLIYRHPHVFGDAEAKNSEDVLKSWEILKLKEGKNKTVLGGVPDSLPSLFKAYRIQDKASNCGFDWADRREIWKKVKEEIDEVEVEIDNLDKDKMEEEFGDLLFSVINAARLYKVNADNALERANQKFIRRFNYVEEKLHEQGRQFADSTLEEMDGLWNEAKTKEKNNK